MFQAFDPAWVVQDDGDIVVVDKPVGVPCMPPRAEVPDDLPSRLCAGLGLESLGVHSRLDSETSGLIAYARSKAGNAQLQADTRKLYTAVVEGWRSKHASIDTPIDGKKARSSVRLLKRQGDRALLSVELHTGRKHQIRRHLASRGAPVAGDRLYEGSVAPRLLLHSSELRIGDRVFTSTPPPDFTAWLNDDWRPYEPPALRRAFRRAFERRYWLSLDPNTNAFRLVHGAADGVPGLAVDLYEQHFVVHLYDEALQSESVVVDALASFEPAGIYVKRRPRQANTLVDTRRDEVAPATPSWGKPAAPMLILEQSIEHAVQLGDGLSTGIFLDQRDARRRVRESSDGANVLNLFAYTGAFSLAAAVGGATSIASVDVSRGVLDVAQAAMDRIGFGAHETWKHDAFEAMKIMRKKDRRFDLIIADPPTYSKRKKSRWTSGNDWVRLAEACFSVSAPGAQLLLSSNDSRMTRRTMRGYVRAAADQAQVQLERMVDLSDPRDFPVYGEHPLKRLWLTLA